MASTSRVSFSHRVDDAQSLDDLKRRLTSVFQDLESLLESDNNFYVIDAKTNNDPNQYKPKDLIIDSSIVEGAIVIYIYDDKKNKIPLSLKSLAGELPTSIGEQFTGDGSLKDFVTNAQFVLGTTAVYVSGLRKRLGPDYTEDLGNQKAIHFIAAPAVAAPIIIDYQLLIIL